MYMYVRACGSFKSANHKNDWGMQIANPRSASFAEGRKSNKLLKSAKFADLRILFADRPPLQRVFAHATRVNPLTSGTGNRLWLREKQRRQDHHRMAARGNL